ncbi:MAG: hypothetical protein QNJ45_15610 [Ardenticatenaceae bacterium]|nr:hypothetical protein [Ardenticatenaceae bacterium]
MSEFIEVGIVRLKPEVTAEDFIVASDATSAAFERVDGFIRRELSCSADGQWLDLVYFRDQQAAKHAEEGLTAVPEIHALMGMMDMDHSTWFHAEQKRLYAR